MPPKRKSNVVDAGQEAVRPKRVSTRGKPAAAAEGSGDDVVAIKAPPKKRTRTKAAKNSTVPIESPNDLEAEPNTNPAKSKAGKASSKNAAKKEKSDLDPGSYTDERVVALFEQYVDTNALDTEEEDTISPEGLMKLCAAADIPMDGVRPLLLAWVCRSKKMGNIYKSEWISGMKTYRIDTAAKLGLAMTELEDLLFSVQPKSLDSCSSQDHPYNQASLRAFVSAGRDQSLKDLYIYVFSLAKAEGQRNVDIETAVALWGVILVPRYPIIADLLAYIAEANGDDKEEEEQKPPKAYKGITKDQWQMTWTFVSTVQPDLSDYDGDGGWPTIFDEFVAWKNSRSDA